MANTSVGWLRNSHVEGGLLKRKEKLTQECLQCGNRIGAVAGMKEAICTNCGWKDPCCE